MAGNGASLAPATSNPRLAGADNGCLIFSIRRAQCRILSFTRGGASEVISPRHSARTPLLCGGAGRPPRRGLAAGRCVQLRPLQRGPAGPAGVGTGAASPGSRPAGSILGRDGGDPPVLPGPARPRPPLSPAARPQLPQPPSPHHTPTVIRDLKCFFLLSPGSQRARRGRSRGDGSLTQSADPGGVQQMVPLTPAAERAALRASGLGALTPPASRMPQLGPRGGRAPTCSSPAPPPALRLLAPEQPAWTRSSCKAPGAGPRIRPCLMPEPVGKTRNLKNLPDQGFPVLAAHMKQRPERE